MVALPEEESIQYVGGVGLSLVLSLDAANAYPSDDDIQDNDGLIRQPLYDAVRMQIHEPGRAAVTF